MVGSLLNLVAVSPMKSVEEQLALIKRGAEEVLVEAELIEKLKRGEPLRIKAASIRPHRTCTWDIPSSLISCASSRSWGTR